MKFWSQDKITCSPVLNYIYSFGVVYPTPSNLSYYFNFGFVALVCLVLQIITGIFLAMHYCPDIQLAFASVDHIMRDVPYGHILRYAHANGASAFFFVVYLHMLKGLYYGSFVYPRQSLWISGVFILLLMIVTAFLGYVLPWGQMSFWAATVITNLLTIIPFFGTDLVIWIWGGHSISNPTLIRFFSLHFTIPFLLLGLVCFHLIFLHNCGSNNPLGTAAKVDNFFFTPFFFQKDFTFLMLFFVILALFIFFYPNYLSHSDNYIEANPLLTPTHIVPEWYFLPFYAILRAFPSKIFGALFFVLSIVVLLVIPFTVGTVKKSSYFSGLNQIIFWFFLFSTILLGWIGGKPVESVYYIVDQICTFVYFLFFIVLLPVVAKFEFCEYFTSLRQYGYKIYYFELEEEDSYDDVELDVLQAKFCIAKGTDVEVESIVKEDGFSDFSCYDENALVLLSWGEFVESWDKEIEKVKDSKFDVEVTEDEVVTFGKRFVFDVDLVDNEDLNVCKNFKSKKRLF